MIWKAGKELVIRGGIGHPMGGVRVRVLRLMVTVPVSECRSIIPDGAVAYVCEYVKGGWAFQLESELEEVS